MLYYYYEWKLCIYKMHVEGCMERMSDDRLSMDVMQWQMQNQRWLKDVVQVIVVGELKRGVSRGLVFCVVYIGVEFNSYIGCRGNDNMVVKGNG